MTTFVDVTATWQQPSDDGAAAPEPASGFVTVTAIDGTGGDPIAVLDPSGDVIYRKAGLRLGLDPNGSVTVRLPASDDAGLNPSGFLYRFEAVIAGSTETHEVEVLSSAAPSVNLADIAPAQAVTASSTFVLAGTLPSRLEDGGSDEMSVAGLAGQLAEAQTPSAHAGTHEGGSDPVTPGGIGAATTSHIHDSHPTPPQPHATADDPSWFAPRWNVTTTRTVDSNSAFEHLWVPKAAWTFDLLAVNVAAAGSADALIRIGVFLGDGLWGYPGTLVQETVIAGDVAGRKEIALSGGLSVPEPMAVWVGTRPHPDTTTHPTMTVRRERDWGHAPYGGRSAFALAANLQRESHAGADFKTSDSWSTTPVKAPDDPFPNMRPQLGGPSGAGPVCALRRSA